MFPMIFLFLGSFAGFTIPLSELPVGKYSALAQGGPTLWFADYFLSSSFTNTQTQVGNGHLTSLTHVGLMKLSSSMNSRIVLMPTQS